MKPLNVSISDANWIRSHSENVQHCQLFETTKNGHKYDIGNIVTLVGLEDFPEFNGEEVEITGFRKDDVYGKTYYIKGSVNKYINWVYEYRLLKMM